MSKSFPSERIQELTAGYVLGDLSSEEAQEFQQLLAQYPELATEVDSLREVREMMAYLPEVAPPPQLRNKVLAAAQTADRSKIKQLKISGFRRNNVVTGIAALLAIAFGLNNLYLRQQLNTAQTQLTQQKEVIAKLQETDSSPNSTKLVMASEAFLQKNWNGIDKIFQDHLRSVSQKQGPVDFSSSNPMKIVKNFQNQLTFTSDVPYVSTNEAKLIGGSFCDFGETQGIRFTYKLKGGQMVSFYQIKRADNMSVPQLNRDRLYIGHKDNPAILIWDDERFFYVLIAPLSKQELEQLAANVEYMQA
ncbi:MAG: hypothetical protein U7127_18805 [Phormidium sp.]